MVVAMLLTAALAGACTNDEEPGQDPIGTRTDPVQLTFMTYGPEEEAAAFEETVKHFNETHEGIEVTLHAVAWDP